MKHVRTAGKRELFFLRLMMVVTFVYALYFLHWFFRADTVDNVLLFSLISITLGYRFLRLVHQWVHLFFLPTSRPEPVAIPSLTVDVFTTFCPGEPYEMVETTLLHIKAIDYPHTTFLCSEGYDERLFSFCQTHGIRFVHRETRENAKAGNINHALQYSSADICVILDPDHRPSTHFIHTVLPAFADPQVGFVQVPQIYHNHDTSVVAKGAAQQTYEFYGPLMQASTFFGTTPAIGANCTFRRAALDSIGGHAAGLTEDMHTSMLLHAQGWRSVFVSEVVSEGLVPANLSSYFKQQLKWSKGSFDLFFRVFPHIFSRLTWSQRMHYLSVPLYFLFGLLVLVDISVPIISLVTGYYPLKCRMDDLVVMLLPLITGAMTIKLFAQRWYYQSHEKGLHLYGEILRMATWWVNIKGLVYAVAGVNVPYIPTPKEDEVQNEWSPSFPTMVLVLVAIAAMATGVYQDWSSSSLLMAGYLGLLTVSFLAGTVMGAGAFLQNKWSKKGLAIIADGIHLLFRKFALIGFVSMFVLWFVYFHYYRDYVRSMADVEPPEMVRVGGVYVVGNGDFANVWYVGEGEKVDTRVKGMKYIRFAASPRDSMEVIRLVDSLCTHYLADGGRGYFVDFMNIHDSVAPESYQQFWKIARNRFWLHQYDPVMVYRVETEEKGLQYLPDTRFVDWICVSAVADTVNIYQMMENALDCIHKAERPVFCDIRGKSYCAKEAPKVLKDRYFKSFRGIIADTLYTSDLALAQLPPSVARTSPEKYSPPMMQQGLKGVHYNVAQDWKDDFQKLTKHMVINDFRHIKEMGANTIYRLGPGMGDRNILHYADEQELQVLYGLMIDPTTDFTDSLQVAQLTKQVLYNYHQVSNYSSISGWNIGDRTLDELKKYYGEPFLSLQRERFLVFVDHLAQVIQQEDQRPVCIHVSANQRTQHALAMIRKYAPHIRNLGFSVYYQDDWSYVASIHRESDYFAYYIATVGGDFYGDKTRGNQTDYVDVDDTEVGPWLSERSDAEKIADMQSTLRKVENDNASGVMLFSYTDKMEGTFTWDGLVDYKGRKKAAYYAVKHYWAGAEAPTFPPISIRNYNTFVEQDSTYRFTADIRTLGENMHIDWMLCQNDAIPMPNAIVKQSQRDVWVKIPKDPEKNTTYRIFLFVSDGENVTTSSYFLPLRWYYK